jgi:hypothetical protein
MTSDSDDLEEALRQNLKLRRELADEVAKAKQLGGIAYRLGWVLYWICLALAGAYALLLLTIDNFEFVRNFPHDPWGAAAVVFFPAIVLYGLGGAFRYVLSGE